MYIHICMYVYIHIGEVSHIEMLITQHCTGAAQLTISVHYKLWSFLIKTFLGALNCGTWCTGVHTYQLIVAWEILQDIGRMWSMLS